MTNLSDSTLIHSADVENLFHEVADLPADARARYFDEHGIDALTRREVEALLRFDSHSGTSLDRDIGHVAQRTLERIEHKHMLCGPYRLKELLGRGGMGTVHLAERVDGEVTQRVAVKLLQPGADDPPLRERFLAERQILASLSHPNIARLLDAGHREDGQPYLAMEYVEGEPIDTYAAGLDVRQKIALFLRVCAAVSYLHRNLVVHRDLKPANIFVTSEGEPKLLDFGIAKMLDLTTEAAATNMRILTPDYASPEQVAGSPVTTSTDIYSLGAVLYKLLTGSSPHQFEGDSVGAIALAILGGKIAPPAKLMPDLKGDLESILMKALRTEPQERYATVEQFAEDLESHLESRPVRARKGDIWYRTRKFIRRHWLPVAAAALAIGGLSGGMLLANRQRAIAQRRFVQVRQLSDKLFDIDLEARKFAGSTKTRQLIVDASLEYLQRLSADAQGDPDLTFELGNAYLRVARVQGVPVSQNLGQMDKAERNLRIAERFLHSALTLQPTNRTALLRLAQSAHDRMLLARLNDGKTETGMLARQAAEWLEKFNPGKSDKSEAAPILNTYLNVANQYVLERQFDEALRLARRGAELARTYNRPVDIGTFLWVSAEAYRFQGDLDRAANDIQESVRILEPLSDHGDQSRTMNYVLALAHEGRILGEDNAINADQSEKAVAILERAFNISDASVHQDPRDQVTRGRLAMAGISLADILRHSDAQRALAIYDHVFRHMAEIKDNASFRRYEVGALAGSSYALRGLDRDGEIQQRLNSAFERLRQLKYHPGDKIKPGSETERAFSALADFKAANGNVSGAIDIYEKLLMQVQAWGAQPDANLTDAVKISRLYATLAVLRRRARQTELAVDLETRRRELWQRWDTRLPNNNFVRRQLDAMN